MIGWLWPMRRGESRPPHWVRTLPVAVLAGLARQRRRRGLYDRCTLILFRRAWWRRRTPAALLDYVQFRRDLGYPLGAHHIGRVREGLAYLRGRRRRQALALLAEADWAVGIGDASANDTLSTIRNRQEGWRAAFAEFVGATTEHDVCVVGNAAWLDSAGLGPAIDGRRVVVRFNRFRGAHSRDEDLGGRHDVWVVAPDALRGAVPAVDWIVVSGPDMRFRLNDWRALSGAVAAGAAILTVPLAPWRMLVGELQAPPSAGLLFLAWLRELLGGWQGIHAIGFGGDWGRDKPYHHADPGHRAVSRHNWEGERQLLREWMKQGLDLEAPR